MFIEVRPDVNVGLLDGVEDELRHAGALPSQQVGLEQSLAGSEPLVINLRVECDININIIVILILL